MSFWSNNTQEQFPFNHYATLSCAPRPIYSAPALHLITSEANNSFQLGGTITAASSYSNTRSLPSPGNRHKCKYYSGPICSTKIKGLPFTTLFRVIPQCTLVRFSRTLVVVLLEQFWRSSVTALDQEGELGMDNPVLSPQALLSTLFS